MKNKEIKKLAQEISFKLLATKDHEDFNWLLETLKKYHDDILSDDANKFEGTIWPDYPNS